MTPMRVIGIDPGLNITGIGVIEADDDATTYLVHTVVRTDAAATLVERLQTIYGGVAAMAAEWMPTAAAVESTFIGNNARSAMLLGHARAAAILALSSRGIPIAEYSPAVVKQSVTGYGRGEKGQVARMVAFQLGLAELPGPLDATDALAVAITHWAQSRLNARL
jgi:crossover junction endodeoxyribonuclease RuvC